MAWKLLLLVGASAIAFTVGFKVESWRVGAQEAKTITKVVTVDRNIDHYITVQAVAAQKAQDRITAHTTAAQQEIPQDVPTGSAADVQLGAGWLWNYNRSLSLPVDPGLAGLAADQPAIRAADALETIDGNNGVCLKYQDAYFRVVAAYDAAEKAVNGFKP